MALILILFLSEEYDMKNLSFHVFLMQYLDDYI